MLRKASFLGALGIGFILSPAATAKDLPSKSGISFSHSVLEEARVASEFGVRNDPLRKQKVWHGGLDLAADWDAAVHAPATGEVIYAKTKAGYGQMVDLKVSDDWVIRFAHLSSIVVSTGDIVEAGAVLGKVGSTGRYTGPHLHLETLYHDKQYNPEQIEGLRFYSTEKMLD